MPIHVSFKSFTFQTFSQLTITLTSKISSKNPAKSLHPTRYIFLLPRSKITIQHRLPASISEFHNEQWYTRQNRTCHRRSVDRRKLLTYYNRVTDDTWLFFGFGSVLQPFGKLPIFHGSSISLYEERRGSPRCLCPL